MIRPLEDEYFGNTISDCGFTMKAREILDYGIGEVALKMNKIVYVYSDDEKIKNSYDRWLKKPKFLTGDDLTCSYYSFATTNSPRFDVYGNDFG